jgi:hypothetical protein
MVNGVNINRINSIFYPIIMICGLVIYLILSQAWNGMKNKIFRMILVMVIPAGYLVGGIFFLKTYFTGYNKSISAVFHKGLIQSVREAKTFNKPLYITTKTALSDYYMVSEILTVFAAKVDPKYRLTPEYSREYHYVSFESETPKNMNAIFIFHESERALFSDKLFKILLYDNYCIAVPGG